MEKERKKNRLAPRRFFFEGLMAHLDQFFSPSDKNKALEKKHSPELAPPSHRGTGAVLSLVLFPPCAF